MTEDQKHYTIGIVGGGTAGHDLLKEFFQSSLTTVAFIVDINPSAPGMVEAKRLKIPTYTDMALAVKNHETDMIFEVTGVEKVSGQLRQLITGTKARMMTHDMAFVILSVIAENNKKIQKEFCGEIREIRGKLDGSLTRIEQMVTNIQDVAAQMRIIAINARIETARAGEAGRAFSVVAEQMNRSVDSIQQMTRQINDINTEMKTVATKIDTALEKLT